MDKKMCNICIEDFKSLIQCSFCDFEACKNCTSKYLVESINESHCMSCKKSWDREFLIKSISLSWYDAKYKPSRKQILFDREKSLFPDTLTYVEIYKQLEKTRKEYNDLVSKTKHLKLEKAKLLLDYNESTDKQQRKELRQLVKEKTDDFYKTRRLTYKLNDDIYTLIRKLNRRPNTITNTKEESKPIPKYYGKCFDEECIGLLNKEGNCVTCDKKTCTKCMEKDEDGHVCNPDTLETVKLIKNDTKACPNCHVLIHRPGGCYQMWCTNCHTTFHYNTGEILNEKIHNPHYIEWLQNNRNNRNRNEARDECERLDLYVYRTGYPTKNIATSMHNIMREVSHIELSIIPNIRHKLNYFNNDQTLKEKRCQYMLKYIPEEKYKTQLFQRYKQTMRWNEVLNFFDFMKTGMTSIIEEYFVTKDFDNVYKQLETLYKYCNEECVRIANIYQNSMSINTLIKKDDVIRFTEFYMTI